MRISCKPPSTRHSSANRVLSAMTQDPEMFPRPDELIPERFIDASDPNLINFTIPFGIGRRLCPGMHIAQQTLLINIAR